MAQDNLVHVLVMTGDPMQITRASLSLFDCLLLWIVFAISLHCNTKMAVNYRVHCSLAMDSGQLFRSQSFVMELCMLEDASRRQQSNVFDEIGRNRVNLMSQVNLNILFDKVQSSLDTEAQSGITYMLR